MKITELEEKKVAEIRYDLLRKIEWCLNCDTVKSDAIRNLAEAYSYLSSYGEDTYEDYILGGNDDEE